MAIHLLVRAGTASRPCMRAIHRRTHGEQRRSQDINYKYSVYP
jgi:hypothetical protein